MTARSWWAARAMEHPLVRVWCIWARRDGQSADISPTAMTCSRYRATRVLNSWTVCKWEKQRRPCCLSVCLPVTHLMQTHSFSLASGQTAVCASSEFPFHTHHSATVHFSLRALPAVRPALRHPDRKDDSDGPWALFPPIWCGTHACTAPHRSPGPTQTNPLLGSPGSDDGSVLTVKKNRAAGRTEHQQPRLHPSGEESPSAPPGGTQGGFSVFLPSRDPTHTRSKAERGFRRTPDTERLYRTPNSCSASNTARHIYGYNMWPLHNVTSRGVFRILYLGGGGAAI